MRKLVLATASLLAMAMAAHAATLQLQYSEDAGATTTVNSANSTDSFSNINTGNFIIRSVDGSTQPDLFGPDIFSGTSIDVSGSGGGPTMSHTLHLTLNALGITGITGLQQLESSFDTTLLTSGWQLTSSSDINGTIIDSQIFLGTGAVDKFSTLNFSSPFNASIHWDISNMGIIGDANVGTVLAVNAVPGPVVGAGLPGLLSALGFWGWKRRKRRVA